VLAFNVLGQGECNYSYVVITIVIGCLLFPDGSHSLKRKIKLREGYPEQKKKEGESD